MSTYDLVILVGLFIFGLIFEDTVTRHPIPANWDWLQIVIRTTALLVGLTLLLWPLSFSYIFGHVWLPILVMVGPRILLNRLKNFFGDRLFEDNDIQETFENAP